MYYLERPVPVQVHFAFALHFLRREESHRECTSESAELEGDLPRGLKNCFCGFAVSGGGSHFHAWVPCALLPCDTALLRAL